MSVLKFDGWRERLRRKAEREAYEAKREEDRRIRSERLHRILDRDPFDGGGAA